MWDLVRLSLKKTFKDSSGGYSLKNKSSRFVDLAKKHLKNIQSNYYLLQTPGL